MITQRTTTRNIVLPADIGMEIRSAGAAANWWDPNGVGLSVAGAYRAINSVGTPWGGGPTAYAQTLVNQADPGVNDLVEGNGAVPWVQATGWGFVAALLQYFDTGLVPANDQSWSMFVQYANVTNTGYLGGIQAGAGRRFGVRSDDGAGRVTYANGGQLTTIPVLLTGNLAAVGAQGFRDGVADGAITAWTGASGLDIYIGARNQTFAFLFITGAIESVAIYDGGPAAVQAEAFDIVNVGMALL